jgi:hypothetical protein
MNTDRTTSSERVLRDLTIERWPLDRLIPYARNARTHTDEQVAQVAASILEFGWTNPILVGGDGVVIAGHARLTAARKLRMTEVPVLRRCLRWSRRSSLAEYWPVGYGQSAERSRRPTAVQGISLH